MNRLKTTEDEVYYLGLWFLGIGSILMFLYLQFLAPVLPEESCFLLNVAGFYCPGCGGTRAVNALFHGDILASLWYHPLVLYTVVVFGGFMLTNTLKKLHVAHIAGWKFHNWYLWVALGIVAVNWIVKNVLLLVFQIKL